MPKSKCTTGCPFQNCPSYAACLKGKGVKVAYANSANGWDYSTQKKWDRDLAAYSDARAQGIQPGGTSRDQVDRAVAISNETGKAWDAS